MMMNSYFKNIVITNTFCFRSATTVMLICLCVLFTLFRFEELNVKCLDMIRRYSADVPVFLNNRPKKFIQYCIRRMVPLVDLSSNEFQEKKPGVFVYRKGNCKYVIKICGPKMIRPTCQCQDFQRFHWPCKHLLFIIQFMTGYSWSSFPEDYKNISMFNLDPTLMENVTLNSTDEEHIEALNTNEQSSTLDVNKEQLNASSVPLDPTLMKNVASNTTNEELIEVPSTNTQSSNLDCNNDKLDVECGAGSSDDIIQAHIQTAISHLSSCADKLDNKNFVTDMCNNLEALVALCEQKIGVTSSFKANRKRYGKWVRRSNAPKRPRKRPQKKCPQKKCPQKKCPQKKCPPKYNSTNLKTFSVNSSG